MSKKQDLEQLLEEYVESKPVILGYCLGIVSKVLANYDRLRKEIKPRHRLTDWVMKKGSSKNYGIR
jgi:hypothetical protein